MKFQLRALLSTMLLAGMLFTGTAAIADVEEGQWYVSPMISFVDDASGRAADDALAGGQVAFGRAIGDATTIEINLSGFNLDRSAGNDLIQMRGFGFDIMRYLPDQDFLSPYVLGGMGYQSTHSNGIDNGEDLTGSIALGLLTWLNDSNDAALRGEVRLRGVLGSPHLNDTIYSIGILAPIGDRTPPPPGDSDGDGVTDDRDRCPGTPIGTAVDANGCKLDGDDDGDGVKNSMDKCPNTARGATVDRNGCKVAEKDSDGDGVVDSKDQCPNTVRGAKVDANGCEFDTDGDGVVDSQDRCPNTTAGVRVDVNGCEITEKISLPGVQFELNSATLKPESYDVLNDAAATLNKHPDIMVEVAGHTDSSGSDSYNMSLSDKRARSVADYLAGRGVSMSRMQSKGYGETQPIADNSTADGRAINRRVELRILNQ